MERLAETWETPRPWLRVAWSYWIQGLGVRVQSLGPVFPILYLETCAPSRKFCFTAQF